MVRWQRAEPFKLSTHVREEKRQMRKAAQAGRGDSPRPRTVHRAGRRRVDRVLFVSEDAERPGRPAGWPHAAPLAARRPAVLPVHARDDGCSTGR